MCFILRKWEKRVIVLESCRRVKLKFLFCFFLGWGMQSRGLVLGRLAVQGEAVIVVLRLGQWVGGFGFLKCFLLRSVLMFFSGFQSCILGEGVLKFFNVRSLFVLNLILLSIFRTFFCVWVSGFVISQWVWGMSIFLVECQFFWL